MLTKHFGSGRLACSHVLDADFEENYSSNFLKNFRMHTLFHGMLNVACVLSILQQRQENETLEKQQSQCEIFSKIK